MKKKLLALFLAASLISMNAMSVLAAEDMTPEPQEEAAVVSEIQTYADDGSDQQEEAAVVSEIQEGADEVSEPQEEAAELSEAPEDTDDGSETQADVQANTEGTEESSNVVDSGSFGNISWVLTSDGTLTLSGSGDMPQWSSFLSSSDKEQIKTIVIGDGVTSIGSSAFSNCRALTSVTIPSSVKEIGAAAFASCSSLTSIEIPNVTSIGYNAFFRCESLKIVKIAGDMTLIDFQTFWHCTALTSVTLPDSVTSIGESAFQGCSALTSITIPDSVTEIGPLAFYQCASLTSVKIPDGVTEIKRHAFRECTSLTSVKIPGTVTSIGNWAFMDCSALTDIVIPDGVTSIGFNAFNGCSSLTSVNLPKTVATIEYRAFANCTGLAQVSIPDSVKAIEYQAFGDCANLSAITFEGDAPELQECTTYMSTQDWREGQHTYAGSIFQGVTAKVYYPLNNGTWTSEVKEKFGENANLVWVDSDSSSDEDNTGNTPDSSTSGAYIMPDGNPLEIQEEATDTTYQQGDGNGATIKCSGDLEYFQDVYVDDELVAKSNYTLQRGSTILTFTEEYMKTLSEGKHDIRLTYDFNTGEIVSISTTLEVTAKSEGTAAEADPDTPSQDNNGAPTSPKTGDAADLWVWMAVLAVLTGSVLACSKLYRTRRQ